MLSDPIMSRRTTLASLGAFLLLSSGTVPVLARPLPHPGSIRLAEAGAAADADDDHNGDDAPDQEPSPEEKMRRRFPQPVRAGFLIGLPMLDYDDSTIGFIRSVVRTPEGKIQLIVGVGGWFGYWAKRLVAVPIEAVAILARQVDALDLSREQIEAAETWDASKGAPVKPDETILIALGRR